MELRCVTHLARVFFSIVGISTLGRAGKLTNTVSKPSQKQLSLLQNTPPQYKSLKICILKDDKNIKSEKKSS